jgi:hypothetical protein
MSKKNKPNGFLMLMLEYKRDQMAKGNFIDIKSEATKAAVDEIWKVS